MSSLRDDMDLLRCDSCAKPLGEGDIGRGDAVKRASLFVCRTCIELEERGHALPILATLQEKWVGVAKPQPVQSGNTTTAQDDLPTSPVSEHCGVCSIPLSDADFSEGRAFRFPVGALCSRCLPRDALTAAGKALGRSTSKKLKPIAPPNPPTAQPAFTAKTLPAPRRLPGREGAAQPSGATPPLAAHAEPRSPLFIASVLLLIVVLPAFVVSLWALIARNGEYDDLAARYNTLASDENARRIEKTGKSDGIRPSDNLPINPLPELPVKGPEPPKPLPVSDPAAPIALSEHVREVLKKHEADIAQPLLKRLASTDSGERLTALADVIVLRAVRASGAVRALLASADAAERQLAATALGELGDAESMPMLERTAESDASLEVRMAARRAIMRLGGEPSFDSSEFTLDELKRLRRQLDASGADKAAAAMLDKLVREREMRGGE